MITTERHGLIDWAVVVLMGRASTSSSLSQLVRTALKTAAVYHGSYSAVTDYKAGLRPLLTMRQHLALDAVGGAALFGAGLLMRCHTPAERTLLVVAGLSELAVAAYSEAPAKVPRPEPVTYSPLYRVKRVADDIFIVDGALPGLMGKALATRMTVIRLTSGNLLIHSPVRFSDGLKDQLEVLGRIAHLVAPNIAHWTFLKDWQRACPDAVVWGAPGLRERAQVQRSGVWLDHDLGETAPALWGNTIKLVMVPGGFGFHEAALFHEPSRTLVLTDLIVNLEPAKLPRVIGQVVRLLGISAPAGMPPPYLRFAIKLRRRAAVRAVSRLLDFAPERVIFAHGRWFESDGARSLRRSLRWLVN